MHPQHIAGRFFLNDKTVKISGIILKKPYKLQITAISKVDAKKKKRKKVIEYNGTLKNVLEIFISCLCSDFVSSWNRYTGNICKIN